MVKIYFDSSVYVKVFDARENGSIEARKIMEHIEKNSNIQIIMSVWTINETIAAIDKKAHQKHDISKEEADVLISQVLQKTLEYSKDQTSGISFVPVDNDIVRGSLPFIYDSHISADDALHVFTAFEQGCEYIITHDIRIRQQLPTTIHGISEKIKMRALYITKKDDIDDFINNLDSI